MPSQPADSYNRCHAEVGPRTTYGIWSSGERSNIIKLLEFRDGRLALLRLQSYLEGKHILFQSDNTTTDAFIHNQGGTRSVPLHAEVMERRWNGQTRDSGMGRQDSLFSKDSTRKRRAEPKDRLRALKTYIRLTDSTRILGFLFISFHPELLRT